MNSVAMKTKKKIIETPFGEIKPTGLLDQFEKFNSWAIILNKPNGSTKVRDRVINDLAAVFDFNMQNLDYEAYVKKLTETINIIVSHLSEELAQTNSPMFD